MEQVEEICDHIVLVNQGRKILDGTVSDVKQNFKENIFSIQLDRLPEVVTSPAFEVIKQQRNKVLVKINEGVRSNDVLQYFIQQNIGIEAFNEVLPSLNDIFIRLVEGTKVTRQFQPIS
jgi:ABC-2 type transport system ATP-binding protein